MENLKKFNEKSIIDINEKKQIINWIKEKTKKNTIEFELIFKMSENGTNSEDFHK